MSVKKIQTALLSVYNKQGIDEIANKLHSLGIKIISTGGTYDYISNLNIPVEKVEDITKYPDLFSGRVKTLHPAIMGGILHKRDDQNDLSQAAEFSIPSIDLVIVDLYPFAETLNQTDNEDEIIEKIDIGGISLIRAAAKNYNDVVCIPCRKYYTNLLELLNKKSGETTKEDRKFFAIVSFDVTSNYDMYVFEYFNKNTLPSFKKSISQHRGLRYGENPHQKSTFFGDLDEIFEQTHGKELSYNNLQDIEAGVDLITEIEQPAFCIIKHGNACGLAVADNIEKAWVDALSCDPQSAFGGILISNREICENTAVKINEIFFEALVAPSFNNEAIEVLKTKKNRILLLQKKPLSKEMSYRSCLNGVLFQDKDNYKHNTSDFKVVTKSKPNEDDYNQLLLANIIVKHTKSNAIVIVKDNKLIGSGMGQTSRIDAVNLAIQKAQSFGHNLNNSVLASDAFFPFADGIEYAMNAGVKTIIQPGGSVRDSEVINFCNKNNIAMIFTGIRHFKH